MRPIVIALGAICPGLVACLPTPSPQDVASTPRSACFFPQAMVNFRADDTAAYVRSSRGETFMLSTGSCRDLSAARALAIVPVGGGGSVCEGDIVNLGISAPTLAGVGSAPCRATVSAPLSQADLAALPSRLRP